MLLSFTKIKKYCIIIYGDSMNKNMLLVIDEMHKLLKNKKVLLACSTGVDSVVLLSLLEQVLDKSNIVIAHVNHKKREQSDIEEEYILNYAKDNNMTCIVKHLDKYDGSNFQAWARDERYKFFKDIALQENIDVLLLAHHANDNLETIIQRLIRSSSLEGYAGIRKISYIDNLMVYRPLITISKEEIYTYAKECNLKYYEDISNTEDDYTRNRIRHHIVPLLEEENPAIYKAISIYSNTLFEANEHLENYETNYIKKLNIVNTNNEFFAKIELDDFLKESNFFQEQIMFRLLKRFKLSKKCIEDIFEQINSNKSNIVKKINDNLLMVKEYGYVIFTNNINKDDFYLEITEEGTYNLTNNTVLEVNKNICYFITPSNKIWYNIQELPIIVRNRKNGDKIKTKIGTVSISDFLTNHKVPYLERKSTLLLCNSENIPLYVLGYVVK